MRNQPASTLVPAGSASRGGVGTAAAVVLIVAWVFALYWRTTLSMAAIWERSETFAHGFVVVPIFLWLVWRQRESLARLAPEPCLPALAGVAIAGAAWLLGELVSAVGVAQFAMVAMAVLSVWAVLGTRVARSIGIPLAFLFFAVPFGEFLVPTLIDRTADFAIFAIRASGVPVYREGNFFMIPSGRWSVVEACSGLRYLIASFMVGALYAYLFYRTPRKRAVFVAVSLVVPIIANWLRAYMIVMLGHLTNNRLAVGVDHLIYGWVFFGVVMGLLFWIGARWREDGEPEPALLGSLAPPTASPWSGRGVRGAALAVLVLTAIWQPLEAALVHGSSAARAALAPIAARGGWDAVNDPLSTWEPDVRGGRAVFRQTYAKDGKRVALYVAFFAGQTPETKAITSSNLLVHPENPRWKQAAAGTAKVSFGERSLDVRTGVVTDEQERLAAWQWYWVDGSFTASDVVGKLRQAWSTLRGHGDPVGWIVVSTPTDKDEAAVRATLAAFVADMLGPIDAALAQAAAP